MKGGTVHFALRRMQELLFSPRFWAAILTISLVLAVTGPFGTYGELALLPRLAYWFAIALTTFLAGFSAVGLLLRLLPAGIGPHPFRIALAGVTAGLPVTAIVVALNRSIFDDPAAATGGVAILFVNCSLIAAAVTYLFGLADTRPGGEADAPQQRETPAAEMPGDGEATSRPDRRPRLLDRLPPGLRGRLAYLSMQDHYVDVHTDKGNTLVLMRLADAIGETAGVAGIRIHRSHWVAFEAVTGSRREKGKLFLQMTDGALLPVSRSFVAAVREAGLA